MEIELRRVLAESGPMAPPFAGDIDTLPWHTNRLPENGVNHVFHERK
jgi:hypothetical protein